MRLIPENMFPIRKKPEMDELKDKILWLKNRHETKGWTESERKSFYRIIDILNEIRRRLNDEYIYYMVPNPAQMKFVRIVTYGRIFQASNKTGKTEVVDYDYILKCLGCHPAQMLGWFPKPPILARLICSDFGSGIKLKMLPLCRKLIPPDTISKYDGENCVFHFNNGSLLELKSNEQDVIKFGSVDRHLIGADEPFREDIFGENITRLATYNGSFDVTQTPDWKDKAPWLRLKIVPQTLPWPDVGETGMTLIRGTYEDNIENLDREGVKKWLAGLSEAERDVRASGNFPEGTTILFGDRFAEGVHTCQPFEVPVSRLKFGGIDIGIGCPTVHLWAFIGNYEDRYGQINKIGDKPILYIYKEYVQRGKTIPENADEIKRLTGNTEIQLTWLDPKSGGKRDAQSGLTNKQHWINAGIPVVLGAINLEAGLNAISSMLMYGEESPRKAEYPELVIFTCCTETIKEMKNTTVDDLKVVDAMHSISVLRWMACANILNNFAGANVHIHGAYYGTKGEAEYRKKIMADSVN